MLLSIGRKGCGLKTRTFGRNTWPRSSEHTEPRDPNRDGPPVAVPPALTPLTLFDCWLGLRALAGKLELVRRRTDSDDARGTNPGASLRRSNADAVRTTPIAFAGALAPIWLPSLVVEPPAGRGAGTFTSPLSRSTPGNRAWTSARTCACSALWLFVSSAFCSAATGRDLPVASGMVEGPAVSG